uniref:Trichohyalin-plectin-homology domain-containing protein n=1 Tax=Noctiluca scintillans TaxID=2966 RepID=A0A7S1FKE6_NOCSC
MAGLVMSSAEIQRIKQTLLPEHERTCLQGSVHHRDRTTYLHQKSQARAATWTNTLEGSRRKKAEEKRKKIENEELERQRIDEDEARIQLEQRRSTIDRAKKLLHDETDRMKSFHSKMMLCDVLKEREAQVTLNDELNRLEDIRHARLMDQEHRNYRNKLERELREKETKQQLSKVAAQAHKEQHADFMEKRFQEIEEHMREGSEVRKKAIEDLEAEKVAQQRRKQLAVSLVQEHKCAIEQKRKVEAGEMVRHQQEEEKIREYGIEREKMLALRRQKEEELFQQKQARRLAIIDAHAERMAGVQDKAHQQLERQVRAKEEADEERRMAKLAQQQRWKADVLRSRKAQIERRQEARQKEVQENVDTAKFVGEWCNVLEKQEQEEKAMKREANERLLHEYRKVADIKRRAEEVTQQQERETAAVARKALDAEAAEFQQYAESCIQDYTGEGKNVIPLIKELRGFKKRLLD